MSTTLEAGDWVVYRHATDFVPEVEQVSRVEENKVWYVKGGFDYADRLMKVRLRNNVTHAVGSGGWRDLSDLGSVALGGVNYSQGYLDKLGLEIRVQVREKR